MAVVIEDPKDGRWTDLSLCLNVNGWYHTYRSFAKISENTRLNTE